MRPEPEGSGSGGDFDGHLREIDNPLSFSVGALSAAIDELSSATNLVCGRASGASCNPSGANSFLQSITYSGCASEGGTAKGTVTLRGSRADCQPPALAGQSMTVLRDLTLTEGGATLSRIVSSDYLATGPSAGAGGGATITATGTADAFEVRVTGIHQIVRDGNGADLSSRTMLTQAPLDLRTSRFDAGARVVRTGRLLVTDNLTRSRLLYSFRAAAWDRGDCCVPTSGAIDYADAADAGASGTIEFTAECGTAIVHPTGGDSSKVSIGTCGGFLR